ncbi:MAG: aldo/keto reductase, partial [Candidatus Aminicenantes bacterium]|nr:aldo/keto reductase [Candidatus Aminicenantes bacterium]
LPVVSIGAASFDVGLYRTALDAGITHIDTSQYYYNGRHETIVAEAIKGRPRDSFVIATSILLGSGKDGRDSTMAIRDLSKLAEKFNSSLERLGLDYVDIFYVASVNDRETALKEELIDGLRQIKKAGKTRFIGVATHQGQPEVLRAAVESKVHEVVLVSYNFRQSIKADIETTMKEAALAGLGIIVMKPMAGAYWDRERTQPINGKAALKWVLQNENVHSTVPGITSMEQLEADLSVMENLSLTEKEKTDLRLVEKTESGGLYCQGCGTCIENCPEKMDIPAYMRSYMYAYGYNNPSKAQGALQQIEGERPACINCSSCQVECPLGLDVRNRILDISRLHNVPEEFLG